MILVDTRRKTVAATSARRTVMTTPLPVVWPYALPFWLVFAAVFIPEMRLERRALAQASADRSQDRGSVRLVVAAGRAAFALGILTAFGLPFATIVHGRLAVFVAGLLLLGTGGVLRSHCRRTLGRFFTGTVAVQADQPVVTSGAYRWVRHPAYTGAVMVMVGVGLTLTNWLSILAFLIVPTLAYGLRVRVEERALLETIGEPYRKYMRRTKRFVPFLF